jgi:cell division protein FtsN
LGQDDYYYEIQLTNKQLVFYFMAVATGLILSFLIGIMVGRGVDATAGEVQAARPVHEERIVPEETPRAAPAAEDLGYAQRLEGEKADDTLERPKGQRSGSEAARSARVAPPVVPPSRPAPPAADASRKPASSGSAPPAAASTPAGAPPARAATAAPAAPKPALDPRTQPARPSVAESSSPGGFTIQVGAFKDKASAESVVSRLKGKGFAAYVVSPEGAGGGLFNVRVGSYPARGDAERIQNRLRDEEKFKPFIVKQ